MEPLFKSIASAIITYTAHYTTVKAYNYLCIPDGVRGYFTGLLTMGSPMCQAGMKIMTHTEVSYTTIFMMGISRLLIDYFTPKEKL
jgi:hypothetical protein